jgi:hypothetical protein
MPTSHRFEDLAPDQQRERLRELARVFLRLGAVAFGGPAAHIAMMNDVVVERREWLDRQTFLAGAVLIALSLLGVHEILLLLLAGLGVMLFENWRRMGRTGGAAPALLPVPGLFGLGAAAPAGVEPASADMSSWPSCRRIWSTDGTGLPPSSSSMPSPSASLPLGRSSPRPPLLGISWPAIRGRLRAPSASSCRRFSSSH